MSSNNPTVISSKLDLIIITCHKKCNYQYKNGTWTAHLVGKRKIKYQEISMQNYSASPLEISGSIGTLWH